jgi:ribosomal protein S27AE
MKVGLVPHSGNSGIFTDEAKSSGGPYPHELVENESPQSTDAASLSPSIDNQELLVRISRAVCHRYGLNLAKLSAIQRKFLTHYRCVNCGLLPLNHVNYTHPKRVRCGRCQQLMSFRRSGKYGKIRKDIVIELAIANRRGKGA